MKICTYRVLLKDRMVKGMPLLETALAPACLIQRQLTRKLVSSH